MINELIKYTQRKLDDKQSYKIIACQHLLESNAEMLKTLVSSGFDPKKIFVIPKAYSYNEEVAEDLKSTGINVSKPYFHSHVNFDSQYTNHIYDELDKIFRQKTINNLLIDDGGQMIISASNFQKEYPYRIGRFQAIEQTSSGYNLLKNEDLWMPVINVARCDAKLELESPHIANLVVSRIEEYLSKNRPKKGYNTLILGAGAIGTSIRDKLDAKHHIETYDVRSDTFKDRTLKSLLHGKDLIIGCTGSTSVPNEFHKYLKNTVLVNAASSDREFEAVEIRKKFPENNDPHKDYNLEGVVLLNSGFPITFQGNRSEVDSKYMQLTQSLMLAAVFQLYGTKTVRGLQNLDAKMEDDIRNKYLKLLQKEKSIQEQINKKDCGIHSSQS